MCQNYDNIHTKWQQSIARRDFAKLLWYNRHKHTTDLNPCCRCMMVIFTTQNKGSPVSASAVLQGYKSLLLYQSSTATWMMIKRNDTEIWYCSLYGSLCITCFFSFNRWTYTLPLLIFALFCMFFMIRCKVKEIMHNKFWILSP